MIILDTNIVIYFQNDQLKQPLPQEEIGISVITEIELFSFSGLSKSQKNWLHRFLERVSIIPLDRRIKDKTIEIRRSFHLKIPDAMITATAVVTKNC